MGNQHFEPFKLTLVATLASPNTPAATSIETQYRFSHSFDVVARTRRLIAALL